MARPRFRLGRILAVFVLFVILCLLLELNRFLPGGWPGGGGEGGARRAGTANLQDLPGTPDADRPGPTRMTEATGRPPVEIPRDGVVIEVRTPDGRFADTWRFGIGDGGPEDPVSAALLGRHASRDRRITDDGFRVRTGGGLLRVRPNLGQARPGHWIVIAPPNVPPVGRQRTQFTLEVRDAWGTSRLARVEQPDGSVEEVPIGPDGTVVLRQQRGPARITPVLDGIVGAPRWIGPRTADPITLEAPRKPTSTDEPERRRLILLPAGDAQYLARFPASAPPSGAAEPEFRFAVPAGKGPTGRSIRVPRGMGIDLLVDDPAQRPYSVTIPAGSATEEVAYQAHSGLALPVRVLDVNGKPVEGAFIVAGVDADPFLALRHATTNAAGQATLRGIPVGPLGVFVAAPDQGFATQRVLLDVRDDKGSEVRLLRGLPLSLAVVNPEGLPIPGVTIDVEPTDGRAPVPSAPRPTADTLPDVTPALRAALGWNDTTTDDRGRWHAEGLLAGGYRIRLRAPGYERLVLEDVEPGAGRTWFVTMIPTR